MRRDAVANREKLLVAAGAVLAAEGLSASVEHIAQEASVSMGTLYRHFPSKEALIAEITSSLEDAVVDMIHRAAQRDDGTGLELLLLDVGELLSGDNGPIRLLWNRFTFGDGRLRDVPSMMKGLVEAAKTHGRVRDDLTVTDVLIAFSSTRAIIDATLSEAPRVWRRHLQIQIAGMRPADERLTERPLSWSAFVRMRARAVNPRS